MQQWSDKPREVRSIILFTFCPTSVAVIPMMQFSTWRDHGGAPIDITFRVRYPRCKFATWRNDGEQLLCHSALRLPMTQGLRWRGDGEWWLCLFWRVIVLSCTMIYVSGFSRHITKSIPLETLWAKRKHLLDVSD